MSTDNASKQQDVSEEESDPRLNTLDQFECVRCGSKVTRCSAESTANRSLKTAVCKSCGFGAAGILHQEETLTEMSKNKLQSRRDSAAFGLSVRRVAAFVTEGAPAGEYLIERTADNRYEVTTPARITDQQVRLLAQRVDNSATHLSADVDGTRLSITDLRVDGGSSEGKPAPDGGAVVASGSMHRSLPIVRESDDPRTKRAKTEDMGVSLAKSGGVYRVGSQSGRTYRVDILESSCTCPDDVEKCKHLRRVAMEINRERVPRPDGKLP